MALGTTNITTSLVGTTIGSASRDVGTLCSASLINKWSKYKPVIYPSITTTGNWWKAVDGNCGLSIPEYSNINNLVTAITNGVTWNYNKPTGGASSPYRLGDFRGYEHGSANPVSDYNCPSESYTAIEGGVITISFINGNVVVDGNLVLADIPSVNQCYIGLAIKNNYGYKYVTSNNTIYDGAHSVNMPIYGLLNGQYDVFVFLARNKKRDIDDTQTTNVFIPLEGLIKKIVILKETPLDLLLDPHWRNDNPSSNYIDCTIVITNNSNVNVTIDYCALKMRYGSKSYDDSLSTGEKTTSLGSMTIPANDTLTINESFNIINSNSSTGWKLWFGSDSPYIIRESAGVFGSL